MESIKIETHRLKGEEDGRTREVNCLIVRLRYPPDKGPFFVRWPGWDGDFAATPVYARQYFLACMRYIELNPVRAGLVGRAQDWLWSSAAAAREGLPEVTAGPVAHALNWLQYVNEAQTEAEVEALRECTRRRRPCITC